jgi:hypothetical protein
MCLLALFCKKSRLHFLFVCKRTHDENATLPTFCGYEEVGLSALMNSPLATFCASTKHPPLPCNFRLSDRCRRSSLVAAPKIIHRMFFVCWLRIDGPLPPVLISRYAKKHSPDVFCLRLLPQKLRRGGLVGLRKSLLYPMN